MKTRCHVAFVVLLLACGTTSASPESTSGGEPAIEPTHGASVYSVYLVVAEPGAPILEETAAPLRERSLAVSVGELGCDEGAAEALGASAESHAVSVAFETRADAEAFAATLASAPAGIAQVTIRCAD